VDIISQRVIAPACVRTCVCIMQNAYLVTLIGTISTALSGIDDVPFDRRLPSVKVQNDSSES